MVFGSAGRASDFVSPIFLDAETDGAGCGYAGSEYLGPDDRSIREKP